MWASSRQVYLVPCCKAGSRLLPGKPSGSGDLGDPSIVIVIVGIAALAAVLAGGIGIGFLLGPRPSESR
jgi:hypothetical protein